MPLRMTVRTYNMANVSDSILERGTKAAGAVFRAAGIETQWIACPCDDNRRPGEFILRIIPKLFGSTRSDFRADHLGFAAVTAEGGIYATVFYDRVEALTKAGDAARVLGFAIAHELGHLLLGAKHASDGIMQAHWKRKDLKNEKSKLFQFSAEQTMEIRERLALRIAQNSD